jgi:hypothetical protein
VRAHAPEFVADSPRQECRRRSRRLQELATGAMKLGVLIRGVQW